MLASVSATKNHRWISAITGRSQQRTTTSPLDETWDLAVQADGQLPDARADIYTSAFFQHLAGDPLQRTYIFRNMPNATAP